MNELVKSLQNIRALLRLLTHLERVTIAQSSPLRVTLRNGTTVPAIAVTGLTYTVSSHGVALLAERGQPLVFPTA